MRSDPRDPSEPARLTVVGASDLERELLGAAKTELPGSEMQRRMRLALGLSAGGAVATAAGVAKASTAAGASSGWITASVVAAVVTGGVVATFVSTRPAAPERNAAAVHAAAPAPARIERSAPSEQATPRTTVHARKHAAAPAPASDLRGEIALVDAVRAAIRASASEHALSLLDTYRKSYPHGAFAPEASVLRIEALEAGGRNAEARGLARAFLAKHPDSPLADRVARVAAAR